jgi:hypothetical protein
VAVNNGGDPTSDKVTVSRAVRRANYFSYALVFVLAAWMLVRSQFQGLFFRSFCSLMRFHLPLLVAAFFCLSASLGLSQVPASLDIPPPDSAYAGAAACAECHAKEAQSYAATPHAIDSSLPSETTIAGSFAPGQNVMRTRNPDLVFIMNQRPDGYYQSAVNISDPQHATGESARFDIVIGSGRHGQSYLFWDGSNLFELPVSWWTATREWVDSPGYPDGEVHWNRSVGPRCLECHASRFTWAPPPTNRYIKDSLVLGIDCERCHGPGALHVARERSKTPPPPGSLEEAIVNPAGLSRDRQVSLCSLCHAGASPPIQPPMTFVAGDDIDKYLRIAPPPADAPVDVHGNQVGAMEQSRCFTSGKLTCSTCHDVHRTQENAESFSGRCLSCHEVKSCGRYHAMGETIRGKCIDCHMPLKKSAKLTAAAGTEQLQLTLREHRIAVYPDAAIQ